VAPANWSWIPPVIGLVGSLVMAFAPSISNRLLCRDETYKQFTWQKSRGGIAGITLQEGYTKQDELIGQVQRMGAERQHAEKTSEFVTLGALILAVGFILQVYWG
jgi:hypothetical protein